MVFKDLFDFIEEGTNICLVKNEESGGEPEPSYCRFVFGKEYEGAFENEEVEYIKPTSFVVGVPELQIWLK